MQINDQATDEAILMEIGGRLEQLRLNNNIVREALADQSGVGRNTVERLEMGNSVQLINFIKICRTLGVLNRFEAILPKPTISPVEFAKLQGKKRRRASNKRHTDNNEWTWGDEQ